MGIFGVVKTFLLRFAITFVFTSSFALLFQFAESSTHRDTNEEDHKIERNSIAQRKYKHVLKIVDRNISFNDFHNIWRSIQELDQEIKRFEDKTDGWSILKSFYFTMTIITTIGFGDVAPKTKEGMCLSIITGFLGIPIMMLTLKSLGELINDIIYKLVRFTEVRVLKREAQGNYNGKILLVTLLMMFVLMLGGGKLEQKINGWTLLEGSYAWFITMSTIGFGDFVISKPLIQGENNGERTLVKTVGVFILLILGLGVVASVINAVSEFYETNKMVKRILNCCFGTGGTTGSERTRRKTRRISNIRDIKRSIMSIARKSTQPSNHESGTEHECPSQSGSNDVISNNHSCQVKADLSDANSKETI